MQYTLCAVEEVIGQRIGLHNYTHALQVLVGDLCTSSYTNRGGVADGKGDGSRDTENRRRSGQLVRQYDRNQCEGKCNGNKVKYVLQGNPEVRVPGGYDASSLSWVDLSSLAVPAELANLNAERTHDSSWVLRTDLDGCDDENGVAIPDPAGLATNDLMSTGRGKL